MLAHGAVLRKNFFSADELIAIVKDFRNAGLTPEEVAIMAFVQKVSLHAGLVDEQDMAELRGYGLSDDDIQDVVLACTARNFFSKTLDALNVVPDSIYRELEPELVQALNIGRPFQV
jgi:alkylhydroperoxidase family enzyme